MSLNEDPSTWRLRTAGGIPYKQLEMNGSLDEEKASISESYIIRGSDLIGFVFETFPTPIVIGNTLFYPPSRPIPSTVGLTTVRTTNVSFSSFTTGRPIDPFFADPDAPSDTYDNFVKITIQYEETKPEDGDDPNDSSTFLTISANASADFIDITGRDKAEWEEDDEGNVDEVKQPDIPRTVTQPLVEWTVKWDRVPIDFFSSILLGRMRSKMGKVNDAPMTILHAAPAKTILFLGFTMNEVFGWRLDTFEKAPVTLELKFLEKNFIFDGKQITHNHFYRPGANGGWQEMFVNGNPTFESTDLNSIFSG